MRNLTDEQKYYLGMIILLCAIVGAVVGFLSR